MRTWHDGRTSAVVGSGVVRQVTTSREDRGGVGRPCSGGLGLTWLAGFAALALLLGAPPAHAQQSDQSEPQWSDPDQVSDPDTADRKFDPAEYARKKSKGAQADLPEELKEAAELDQDKITSPFKSQVRDVTERAPRIDPPKDIRKRPGTTGTPKSPLVQINKSGLKPGRTVRKLTHPPLRK